MNPIRVFLIRALAPAALLLCLTVPAFGRQAPTDVLGLTPGMSDTEVQRRLEKIGEVVRGKDRLKQTWKLRDPRYGYLVVRFDEEWRMHWVTALAREGGRRVRYRDIGDPALATHTGGHFYHWTIPDRRGSGTWTVVARGGDPRYLDSVSIQASAMRQALTPTHQRAGPASPAPDTP